MRTTGIYRLGLLLLGLTVLPAGCAKDGHEAKSKSTASKSSRTEVAQAELIPRKVLFGNPDRSSVEISPDGKHISFLAPREGVMNVYVAPVDDPSAATPVTYAKKRGIPFYSWAFDSRHILYGQDQGGNENWNVFSVDIDKPDDAKNLTPNEKVAARIA